MGEKIITRSSVLFAVTETTEGTPVAPTGATQAVELQDGFDCSPQFETLQTASLRSSIGRSKPIIGGENPAMQFSHYLKASGTAGTAPEWKLYAKSLFGGEEVEGTEYTTTVGSTVTSLAVTSIGANGFAGQALLIQDPVNGSRLRAAHSLTTNAAELSFSLPTAPGTGVSIGKPVTYYPANSGHPTFTSWLYMGNGGTTFMLAGSRCTSMTITAEANQLINMDFDVQARGFYQNPIEITASTCYLDWTDADGTFAAAVPIKWYKSPHELASALQVVMRAASAGETATVTYSDTTGKFTIRTTGTVLSLLWNTGANTANTIGTKIGFSVAADDSGTGATTGYTSDNAQSFAAPYTPTYDDADALVAKNMEVMFGDQDDYVCAEPSRVVVTVSNTVSRQGSICSETGTGDSRVTGRDVSVQMTVLLEKYDADKFERYRSNTESRFQFSFGEKSGGNWIKGKCGIFYLKYGTITEYDPVDIDGQVGLNVTITGFVPEDGSSECFLSLT